MNFLLPMFVSLALAFFISETLRKAGIPRVVGQIGTGMLLGIPLIKNMLFSSDIMGAFGDLSDIAIILLFFFVGLELNMNSLRSGTRLKEAVSISFFNTLIPFAFAVALAYALDLSLAVGVILGIAFAVSSQTVTFNLLEEFGLLKSRMGTMITTSGAVDDILEFVLISIILTLTAVEIEKQLTILEMFTNILAFIGIIAIFKFFIIPRLLEVFEKQKSQRALFAGAMIITTLMAYLADLFGISSLIGALVAGILVRSILLSKDHPRPWKEHAIAKSIDTVTFGFFVPLFFVFIGLNFTLDLENIWLGFLLSFFAIGTTVLGAAIGVVSCGGKIKEAILIGLGVTPKGDVELVIVSLALGSGLITQNLYSAIVFMAIMTTLAAPFMFRYFARKWRDDIS